jgi:hypothetical protein
MSECIRGNRTWTQVFKHKALKWKACDNLSVVFCITRCLYQSTTMGPSSTDFQKTEQLKNSQSLNLVRASVLAFNKLYWNHCLFPSHSSQIKNTWALDLCSYNCSEHLTRGLSPYKSLADSHWPELQQIQLWFLESI